MGWALWAALTGPGRLVVLTGLGELAGSELMGTGSRGLGPWMAPVGSAVVQALTVLMALRVE
ncbi:hypothetical protein EV645_4468 [Kribbella rubisoli]|uniref:Uncharacterized protein n=1 Tax=Kribbella rubisoli TaxID=3075929 RepID=A0A4Q7WT92_9ACTN|nr:hypothetical protein EV645_4468 [Kribbella rubisoli]